MPGRVEAGVQRPDRAAARRPAAAPAVRPPQLRGALQPPHSQPAAETLQTSAQADKLIRLSQNIETILSLLKNFIILVSKMISTYSFFI